MRDMEAAEAHPPPPYEEQGAQSGTFVIDGEDEAEDDEDGESVGDAGKHARDGTSSSSTPESSVARPPSLLATARLAAKSDLADPELDIFAAASDPAPSFSPGNSSSLSPNHDTQRPMERSVDGLPASHVATRVRIPSDTEKVGRSSRGGGSDERGQSQDGEFRKYWLRPSDTLLGLSLRFGVEVSPLSCTAYI